MNIQHFGQGIFLFNGGRHSDTILAATFDKHMQYRVKCLIIFLVLLCLPQNEQRYCHLCLADMLIAYS